MHADHSVFLEGIEHKQLVTICFFQVKDQRERTLTVAPLDFGPLRGESDTRPRYQLWNIQAKRPPYNITALPEDVRSIALHDTTFDPASIITWAFKPNAWAVARDWGKFS